MVSVTDLTDYLWCQRHLWLKKKLAIREPVSPEKTRGVEFHSNVHALYEQIKKTLTLDLPGKIIGTEITLPQKASSEDVLGLVGRLDVLRQTSDGYIVQDEKYTNPPKAERIYQTHKLQLDAYCFLVEKDGYNPLKSAVIIYNDLIPREVSPEPDRVPYFVSKTNALLRSDLLPRSVDKCQYCPYAPLSAILPEQGGVSADEILYLKHGLRPKRGFTTVARFESRSRPGNFYTVERLDTGELSCDCPGWIYKRRCWHVEKSTS